MAYKGNPAEEGIRAVRRDDEVRVIAQKRNPTATGVDFDPRLHLTSEVATPSLVDYVRIELAKKGLDPDALDALHFVAALGEDGGLHEVVNELAKRIRNGRWPNA